MSKVSSGEYPTYSENENNNKNTLGEIIEFLTEMSSQNNRGTAFPYYYVILDKKKVSCDASQSDYYLLLDEDYVEIDEEDFDEETCHRWYYQEIDVEHGMFLTEIDAKEHLEANSHHYSNKATTYVKCSWRAPHLENFFNNLFEFFGVKIPPELYYEKLDKEAECKTNS